MAVNVKHVFKQISSKQVGSAGLFPHFSRRAPFLFLFLRVSAFFIPRVHRVSLSPRLFFPWPWHQDC